MIVTMLPLFLETKNPVLRAFSVYSNAGNLFACKLDLPSNIMPCIDGIRAIAALWIVAAHFDYFASRTVANLRHHVPTANRLNQIFTTGRFSVDTFFVLSSMLAANKMLHELSM